MTKVELGIKRICGSCATKFYDLHKDPVVCPKCDAVFVLPKPTSVRPSRTMRPLPAGTTATPDAPAKSVPRGDASEEAEGSEESVVEERLDGKKADDGFSMLEGQDQEDDAPGVIDGSIENDDEV